MESTIAANSQAAHAAVQAGLGCWDFDAARAAAASAVAVRTDLQELGVITAAGEDAVRFLHAQLTGDVEKLGINQLALNGFCTAKGRLLATFRIWRDESGVHLLLPRELLSGVLKRLSMFVLRAKVKLTDASVAWRVWSVFGRGAAEELRAIWGDVPSAVGQCVRVGGVRIARLHGSTRIAERYLLLCPAADAGETSARIAGLTAADSGAFWAAEIDAGVPTVFLATQEKFVPQMINFEIVGGVSFSKGCYPGQEVVARSQYRGKLKRRMQLARCAIGAAAGADVFAGGEAEAVGTVVMAARTADGGFDLLFECPLEKLEGTLHLGSPAGAQLALRPLPYDIVDVTS